MILRFNDVFTFRNVKILTTVETVDVEFRILDMWKVHLLFYT